VVGSDGSGKSTLTGDLRQWFAPKFDTLPLYFGSGDGPSSLVRAPLRLVRKLVLGSKQEIQRKETVLARHPRSAGHGRTLWALTLAYEKHRKLRRATLARTRGMLVITDRYPQVQVPGTNDGPLLWTWRDSDRRVERFLARVEARPYERADRFPPDLVLRLNVDPDTAAARRPEHDVAFLERRIGIVASLEYPEARIGVVELDATEPYDAVLRRAIDAVLAGM
jgi:thymidylate kinase